MNRSACNIRGRVRTARCPATTRAPNVSISDCTNGSLRSDSSAACRRAVSVRVVLIGGTLGAAVVALELDLDLAAERGAELLLELRDNGRRSEMFVRGLEREPHQRSVDPISVACRANWPSGPPSSARRISASQSFVVGALALPDALRFGWHGTVSRLRVTVSRSRRTHAGAALAGAVRVRAGSAGVGVRIAGAAGAFARRRGHFDARGYERQHAQQGHLETDARRRCERQIAPAGEAI